MPVFGTIASRFNDEGTTALYQHLRDDLARQGPACREPAAARGGRQGSSRRSPIVPGRADALPGGDRRDRAQPTTDHREQAEPLRQAQQVGGHRRAAQDAVDDPAASLVGLAARVGATGSTPESRELLSGFAALHRGVGRTTNWSP